MLRYKRVSSSDRGASDASAFAGALGGAAVYNQELHAKGVFEGEGNKIINNEDGGIGAFFEAHHAARPGVHHDGLSNTFGGADLSENGELYNVKAYANPENTFRSSMTLTESGDLKYAGQNTIVPADQLEYCRQRQAEVVAEAYANGNVQLAQKLESMQFMDRVPGDPRPAMTYDETREAHAQFKEGVFLGYADGEASFGECVDVGMSGFMWGAAMGMIPLVLKCGKRALNGQLTPEEAGRELSESLKPLIARSATRGSGSAVLAFAFPMLEPVGAALIVNIAMDLYELQRNPQLAEGDIGAHVMKLIVERVSMTAATAGAVWVCGPLGLIVPFMLRHCTDDPALQKRALESWKNVSDSLEEEIRQRAEAARKMRTTRSHNERTERSGVRTASQLRRVNNNLREIRGLLAPPAGEAS